MLRINALRYRLSTPPKVEFDTEMPYDFRVFSFFLFPLLNLSSKDVLMLSANDPKEKMLSKLYVEMVKRNQALIGETNMQGKIFTRYCDYAELLEYYRKKQYVSDLKNHRKDGGHSNESYTLIMETYSSKEDIVELSLMITQIENTTKKITNLTLVIISVIAIPAYHCDPAPNLTIISARASTVIQKSSNYVFISCLNSLYIRHPYYSFVS